MKTVWINREGLLRNRVSGIQYGAPVVFVHDGVKLHMGYGLKVPGPSQFVYLNLNGEFKIQLEVEGSVEIETEFNVWETIE